MHLGVVAFIVVCIFIFLGILEFLWDEFRSHQRRRVILRKYAHTEKILFTLKRGNDCWSVGGAKDAVFLYWPACY